MYQYQYARQKDIEELTERYGISISELAIRHEAELAETDVSAVAEKMKLTLDVMKNNVGAGVKSTRPSMGGLIGQNAARMYAYAAQQQPLGGS